MNQLLAAIALEVAYQQRDPANDTDLMRDTVLLSPDTHRLAWLCAEMVKLAEKSGVNPTEVTFYHLVEVFAGRARNVCKAATAQKNFVVFWKSSKVLVGGKNFYAREHDARRRALALSQAHSLAVARYLSEAEYLTHCDYVLRRNLQSQVLYVEVEGTPSYCSPACESYWSM